jgi:predicted RNA-binding Zn ribbon-like protein
MTTLETGPSSAGDGASARVPAHVKLLSAFVNTFDAETGADELSSGRDLTGWLVDQGLLTRRTSATKDDLVLARELRDGLRAALASHHGTPQSSPLLEQASERLPLRVTCTSDDPCLEPMLGGVPGALSRLLIAVNRAIGDDTWPRLKICPMDDCAVAFYDTSKNRSKTWCSMESCGNRAKTRAYRARQARSS